MAASSDEGVGCQGRNVFVRCCLIHTCIPVSSRSPVVPYPCPICCLKIFFFHAPNKICRRLAVVGLNNMAQAGITSCRDWLPKGSIHVPTRATIFPD
eukprot:15367150-Ditylum_brightwellii.AAC.3